MHSRSITHTETGSVTLSLDITAGPIQVRVEEGRTRAEVILHETFDGDDRARALIDDTTTTSTGSEFTVTIPAVDGAISGGTTIFTSDGITSIVSGGGAHNVVQAGNISGGVIMGGGQVIIGGVNVTNQGPRAAGGLVAVDVALPTDSAIKVQTVASNLEATGHLRSVRYRGQGGSVTVDSTTSLDVDTSGGSIRADRADAATVHTSGGSIWLGETADADLDTSGGNVTVTRLAGKAKLNTSGGNVTAHAVANSTIRARTSGGNIEITKERGVEVDCDATSHGGRVRTPTP
jgi:hypothetical protein